MDDELRSMTTISDLFSRLDKPAIARVLTWAHEKYLGTYAMEEERRRVERLAIEEAERVERAREAELQRQREEAAAAEQARLTAKEEKTRKRQEKKAAELLEQGMYLSALQSYYELASFPFIRRCEGDGRVKCGSWANRFSASPHCLRHVPESETALVRKRVQAFEDDIAAGQLERTWRPSQALLKFNWEKRIVEIPERLTAMISSDFEPEVIKWSNTW